jgi:DNA polymerase-3 subunit alpha
MAFATLEDPSGGIELIVFPRQYEQYAPYLKVGRGIYVEGELTVREGEHPKVTVNRLTPLLTNEEYASAPPRKATSQKLYLRVPGVNAPVTKSLLRLLKCVKGDTSVILYDETSKKYLSATGYSVNPDDKLMKDLRTILGSDAVILR